MANVIIKHKWRRQPSGALTLNDGHWLRSYLRFVVVNGQELIARPLPTVGGSAKIVGYGSRDGGSTQAELLSASSSYYEFPHDPRYAITGNLGLFWSGTILSSAISRHFVGKHGGSGGANNPFDFRTDPSTGFIESVRANATGYNFYFTSRTLPTEAWTTATFTGGPVLESDHYVGSGGVLETAAKTGSSTGPATGSGATLRIGRRADGNIQMNGYVELVWGAAVVIPAALYRELHEAPWQIVAPARARIYSFATAGGATEVELMASRQICMNP